MSEIALKTETADRSLSVAGRVKEGRLVVKTDEKTSAAKLDPRTITDTAFFRLVSRSPTRNSRPTSTRRTRQARDDPRSAVGDVRMPFPCRPGVQFRRAMYDAFNLVLQVNHACNLRCTYCYTGAKFSRPMSERVARTAVDRALASLQPEGLLELGFFGGEPLVEATLIRTLIDYSYEKAEGRDIAVVPSLTTNGTCTDPAAWNILSDPEVNLSVSHDGLPEIHDRHRLDGSGKGSSGAVEETLRRLIAAGREFNVIMVVRPDSAAALADGIRHLRRLGVRRVEPSLDLWTRWTPEDIARLRTALAACADLWRAGLPDDAVSWFDEKLVRLSGVPVHASSRCGYGAGQIAVAPSGNLYPCERLIGEDLPGQPSRLPGTAFEGADFLAFPDPGPTTCRDCPGEQVCGVTCRCSNFIRTGRPDTPDDLLCTVDRICFEETIRVLNLGREIHGR